MTPKDLEEVLPAFPSPIFLAQFHEHVNDTLSHSLGHDGEGPLEPSCLNLSCWSSDEKDLFFHGLSVHSRLRPDLISLDIGTKNIAEVTSFIDMLEEGVAREKSASLRPSWSKPPPDEPDWSSIPRVRREDFSLALEMSGHWCKFETRQAAAVIAAEPILAARALEKRHKEETYSQRFAFRKKKGTAKTENGERDRKGEKIRKRELKAWVEAKEQEWERAEFGSKLDGSALVALDAVLREEEDRRRFAPSLGEGDEDDEGPQSGQTSAQRDSTPAATAPAPMHPATQIPNIDMELIDPALRSTGDPYTSFPLEIATTPISGSYKGQPDTLFNSNTPPFATASLPPATSIDIHVPASPTTHVSGLSSGTNPEELSPASRRRLYKRLYMRRKRAEMAGTEVDNTLGRLKPGRKGAPRKQGSSSADLLPSSTSTSAAPTPQAEPQPKEAQVASNKSGMTGPYKTRMRVNEMGFDAGKIREDGLDLFRLTNLYKLMRSYNELHGSDPSVASSISIEFLKLLREHVVQFVRSVAKKACLSRSFERKTKAHTKVWRISQRPIIRKRNIKHALALYYGQRLSKKRHFGQLLKHVTLKRVRQTASPGDTAEEEPLFLDDEDDEGTDEDNEAEETAEGEDIEVARLDWTLPSSLPPDHRSLSFEREGDKTKKRMPLPLRFLSTLRTIAPPHFRLPSDWVAIPPVPASYPTNTQTQGRGGKYETYTPWGNVEYQKEDGCIPYETDEEELWAELDEEEELDAMDVDAEDKCERALWSQDWQNMSPDEASVPVALGGGRRLRTRKRKRGEEEGAGEMVEGQDRQPKKTRMDRQDLTHNRRVEYKSKEYISDSD